MLRPGSFALASFGVFLSAVLLTTPVGPTGSVPPLDGPVLSAWQEARALRQPRTARPSPVATRRELRPALSLRTVVDDIRNFRAVSLADDELGVTVDYAYTGDYGGRDIFLHAAALQTDDWNSRVPGTSFPEAEVHVGDGTVTITIKKVLETGTATSTRVKLCMVSIAHRSAFVCRTFPYTKTWAAPASVPAGPAEADAHSPI